MSFFKSITMVPSPAWSVNTPHQGNDGNRSGCFIGGNEAFVCLTK